MGEARKKLVVIDDSPVEVMIFKALTKEIDCDVFITQSFDEAVEHCSANKVDVLITDLNIGEQSGFDVIDAAQANPDNQDIKAFICSSESYADHKERMKSSSIGWIVKPVESKSMQTALTRMLT